MFVLVNNNSDQPFLSLRDIMLKEMLFLTDLLNHGDGFNIVDTKKIICNKEINSARVYFFISF